MTVGAHTLVFPEDIALLVETTPEQLAAVVDVTVSVSRLARAKRRSPFLLGAPTGQHREYLDELLARIDTPQQDGTALCILDTGVTRAHRCYPDFWMLLTATRMTLVAERMITKDTDLAWVACVDTVISLIYRPHPTELQRRIDSSPTSRSARLGE